MEPTEVNRSIHFRLYYYHILCCIGSDHIFFQTAQGTHTHTQKSKPTSNGPFLRINVTFKRVPTVDMFATVTTQTKEVSPRIYGYDCDAAPHKVARAWLK
jgi:hypothetical protein